MITSKHFGRIDLQEAYNLFGLIEVDFDETYPHNTAKLESWIRGWSPYITSPPIAIQEGKNIRIILSNDTNLLCITGAKRVEVVTATVVLLNLVRPYVSLRDYESLTRILKNIFTHFTLLTQ